jgi:hypothetical protein
MTLHIESRCPGCGVVVSAATFHFPEHSMQASLFVSGWEEKGYEVYSCDTISAVASNHKEGCKNRKEAKCNSLH